MQLASSVPSSRSAVMNAWLGGAERSRSLRGYATAAAAVGATIVIRVVLEVLFEQRAPTYFVFLAPVFVASVFGGIGPGLFATVLAWAIANFVFVDPAWEFKTTGQDLVIAGVFMAEGAAIALIGGRLGTTFSRLVERENQLAASEARLLMAQGAARIATYEWEPATGKARWSENAESILGREPGTFAGTFEDSLRNVMPEDQHIIDDATERLMREGESEMETRMVAHDGEIRWIHSTGTMIRAEDGSIDRVVGVMIDVSEQRRQAAHSDFLADATAELARSLDYRSNIAGLADVAVPRFADLATIVLVRDGRFPGEVVAMRHRDEARLADLENLKSILLSNPDRPGAIAASIRSGEPFFMPSLPESTLEQMAVSPEHLASIHRLQVSAAMCIPLVARATPLGGLVFACGRGRSFDLADYQVGQELGRRASLAIENALLLEQSFDREGEASRANEALQLIADAGMVLTATLELNETLESLVQLVASRFADVCSVSLVEGEGELRQAAIAASTPDLRQKMLELSQGQGEPDPELFGAANQAIRSDRPIFLPEVPPEMVARMNSDPGVSRRLREIDPRSGIIMPLTARSQTLGVMSFIRTGERPGFDREDLSLAGQIARRTAIAADNAMLYAEARRANDAKDEFLGMMSHELRTPITVIHGGSRVLRSRIDTLDDETRSGLLHDMERESERLSRMLENLLALARAELDREVVLEPVLLQRLLPRLLGSFQSDTGREVRFATDGDMPSVSAEPGYIEHIVRNLVGNAVKYSPPDTAIDVIVQTCGGGASVRVLDRGFGVSEEEAGRIFERFYRSDRTSRLASGAGLGLAVCKRLVEAMSGRIWATPREGGGLEVGFSLPPYNEEDLE